MSTYNLCSSALMHLQGLWKGIFQTGTTFKIFIFKILGITIKNPMLGTYFCKKPDDNALTLYECFFIITFIIIHSYTGKVLAIHFY